MSDKYKEHSDGSETGFAEVFRSSSGGSRIPQIISKPPAPTGNDTSEPPPSWVPPQNETDASGGTIVLEMLRNEFTEILVEMFNTFEAKNHDYSNASKDLLANFRESEKYGVSMVNGVLVRMSDKMCRLQTLVTRHAKVKTEAIEDTLTDLAVYSIIARMAVQDQKRSEELECL